MQKFHTTDDWISFLGASLNSKEEPIDGPLVLDLFAGCGGLALGFESAGFQTIGFEKEEIISKTYNLNLNGNCITRELVIGDEYPDADIIIGGPPCQPFSVIGYQRGKRDQRDGFPVFLDAVRQKKPKIAIIENVRGLLYRNKKYLFSALSELEGFGYVVDYKLLKATQFGVPQNRERLFVVASKIGWSWPAPTVGTPVTAGMALGKLATDTPDSSRYLTESMDQYIAAYEKKSQCINPRDLHLDRPARTLTCRNIGGATSDMMRIKLPDGRRRMLMAQEAARLQSFPDRFSFEGTEYQQFEQIGNAVPPLMSRAIANHVMAFLLGQDVSNNMAHQVEMSFGT